MLATLLLAPALVAAGPSADKCVKPGADRATSRPARSARARPLGEMPPARGVLTVYRRVDGCPVVLVRDGGRIIEEPADRAGSGLAVRR